MPRLKSISFYFILHMISFVYFPILISFHHVCLSLLKLLQKMCSFAAGSSRLRGLLRGSRGLTRESPRLAVPRFLCSDALGKAMKKLGPSRVEAQALLGRACENIYSIWKVHV